MAIIKLGTTVVGIAGTIGGITFSRNKGGPYIRSWGNSPNQRKTLQNLQRSYIAGMAAAWRACTAAQRTAWNVYAALVAQQLTNSLGQTYFASGFAWFTSMNTNRLHRGIAINFPAPVLARPAAVAVTTYQYGSLSNGNCSINWSAGTFPGTLNVVVHMRVERGIGNLVPTGPFIYVAFDNTPDLQGINFTANAIARTGFPVLNAIAFYRLFAENAEGRRSTPTQGFAQADLSP